MGFKSTLLTMDIDFELINLHLFHSNINKEIKIYHMFINKD